jgi:type III restriction enzyme
MELKKYQDATLAVLRRFLETARVHGAASAYAAITSEPEQAKRLRGYGGTYVPLTGLADTPYVCLRLPTGGGKTLLAAHAIAVAKDAWIKRNYPLVLWLVPSNMIRAKTVEALNDPRHPYAQALDAAFDGRVKIFDIGDFTRLRPQDLKSNVCIIIGTIQSLRVDKTEGRKV